MCLKNDGTISFDAKQEIQIEAEKDIELKAENEVNIRAAQNVALTNNGLGGSVSLTEGGQVAILGSEVKIN